SYAPLARSLTSPNSAWTRSLASAVNFLAVSCAFATVSFIVLLPSVMADIVIDTAFFAPVSTGAATGAGTVGVSCLVATTSTGFGAGAGAVGADLMLGVWDAGLTATGATLAGATEGVSLTGSAGLGAGAALASTGAALMTAGAGWGAGVGLISTGAVLA